MEFFGFWALCTYVHRKNIFAHHDTLFSIHHDFFPTPRELKLKLPNSFSARPACDAAVCSHVRVVDSAQIIQSYLNVTLVDMATVELGSAAEAFANLTSSLISNTTTDSLVIQQSTGWFGYLAWLVWSLVYKIIKLVTITLPTFMLTPFSAKWTLTLHATTL